MVGSEIQVISPDGDYGPWGQRPKLKSFRVAGIFTTGMYAYDQKLSYMTIDDALSLFLVQLEADGRSPHTIEQYRRHVRALPYSCPFRR